MYYPNRSPQSMASHAAMATATDDKTPVAMLTAAAELILDRLMFNERSKDITHSLNLQGFKRWHRYNTRRDMENMMHIKSYIIDHYHELPEVDNEDFKYLPVDLKAHLETWCERDKNLLASLSQLKTDLIVPGNYHVEASLIQELLEEICCEIKYLGRYMKELEDEEYSAYCIYQISRKVHEYFKKKELEVQHIDIY